MLHSHLFVEDWILFVAQRHYYRVTCVTGQSVSQSVSHVNCQQLALSSVSVHVVAVCTRHHRFIVNEHTSAGIKWSKGQVWFQMAIHLEPRLSLCCV